MRGPAERTVIAWSGLPVYAARLLRPVVARYPVQVVASRAQVGYVGVEEHLGAPIHWVDQSQPTSWEAVGLPVPGLLIHTGWNLPAFNALAEAAVAQGAWRVSMIDNNWKGTLRQRVGRVVFRLAMRRRFSRVIVPGRAGIDFVRRLGVPPGNIFSGMYGADPELFPPGPPGSQRPRRCLFVGQFIERKGLVELLGAWKASGAAAAGWELRCFGSGPLASLLGGIAGVRCEGFAQADQLSAELRQARALVLPSREEHWGVVVHEAALSGCALVVSSAAGATADLVDARNGLVVPPRQVAPLTQAFRELIGRPSAWFDAATAESVKLAGHFGPARWLRMYEELLANLQAAERSAAGQGEAVHP
jgi:glycosyltransferase involved in cell wall biosynthesis